VPNNSCAHGSEKGLFRCKDCGHGTSVCCQDCLLTKHRDLELHRIEVSLISLKLSIFTNVHISGGMEIFSKRRRFRTLDCAFNSVMMATPALALYLGRVCSQSSTFHVFIGSISTTVAATQKIPLIGVSSCCERGGSLPP
jgi:hypothetical protein